MPTDLDFSTRQDLSTKNFILNSLPKEDLERLLPHLEPVEMPRGKILYLPDQRIEYIYFPATAMISMISTTPEGQTIEAGVVGWEGMTGFNVLLGVDLMPIENNIQLPGDGLRMKAGAAVREFSQGGAFQKLSLRFIHAVMMQIGQTALCNRLHSSEERLARWLLLSEDRSAAKKLPLTHEFLAVMLGANRSSVTVSAIALQSGGYIKYSRGIIAIIDREGLERFTCSCYQTVKDEYDRYQKLVGISPAAA